MRKIICGKRYDTETAILVGKISYGHPGDFDYRAEALYRTARGGWFLAGEGGAQSLYAERCAIRAWKSGSDIWPMTELDARTWAEDHLDDTVLEAHFPHLIEDA